MTGGVCVRVCVCLQEHHRAAESRRGPGGEQLLPPAARLRHHRFPDCPPGSDQLHLQVAAAAHREMDPLHTQTLNLRHGSGGL